MAENSWVLHDIKWLKYVWWRDWHKTKYFLDGKSRERILQLFLQTVGELWPGAKAFNVKTSWRDNFRNAIEGPIIESFENESCLNSFYNKIYFAPSLTQFVFRGTIVYLQYK